MKLKIYIIEQGLNQKQFAELHGFTEKYVSEMCSKKFVVEDGVLKSNRRIIKVIEGEG